MLSFGRIFSSTFRSGLHQVCLKNGAVKSEVAVVCRMSAGKLEYERANMRARTWRKCKA
jgi:hypothetical protein